MRGSKRVEADVTAEEEPAREMEVNKGFESERKQLVFNRRREERSQRDGREVCEGQSWGTDLFCSTWSCYG